MDKRACLRFKRVSTIPASKACLSLAKYISSKSHTQPRTFGDNAANAVHSSLQRNTPQKQWQVGDQSTNLSASCRIVPCRISHPDPQLKGCVLIACWGVPGRSYPDNGKRCLAAAVEMKAGLLSKDMKTSMGVTTGHVGDRCEGIVVPLAM